MIPLIVLASIATPWDPEPACAVIGSVPGNAFLKSLLPGFVQILGFTALKYSVNIWEVPDPSDLNAILKWVFGSFGFPPFIVLSLTIALWFHFVILPAKILARVTLLNWIGFLYPSRRYIIAIGPATKGT